MPIAAVACRCCFPVKVALAYAPKSPVRLLRRHKTQEPCCAPPPPPALDRHLRQAPLPCQLQNQEYGASAAEVPRDSVYAIGMSGAGTLVATGSTQVPSPGIPCFLVLVRFFFLVPLLRRRSRCTSPAACSLPALHTVMPACIPHCYLPSSCRCSPWPTWWTFALAGLPCSSRGTPTTSGGAPAVAAASAAWPAAQKQLEGWR